MWFRLDQGMDPFDKNTWRRAKVYSDSPHVTEVASIDEQKQLEWTSGKGAHQCYPASGGCAARNTVPAPAGR